MLGRGLCFGGPGYEYPGICRPMQGISLWPFCGWEDGRFAASGWKSEASIAQHGMFNQHLMKKVAHVWSLVLCSLTSKPWDYHHPLKPLKLASSVTSLISQLPSCTPSFPTCERSKFAVSSWTWAKSQYPAQRTLLMQGAAPHGLHPHSHAPIPS